MDLYRRMVLIRPFEEACQSGFRQGKIGGYLHLYIGQEAVATGFLRPSRKATRSSPPTATTPTPCCLGSHPNEVMAELYGKGTGLVKGKGGSMHLFDVENGPVGRLRHRRRAHPARRRHGLRPALPGDRRHRPALPRRRRDHNGAFHEAANLAGLWGRDGMNPTLFILENNNYGMGTSVERATAMTDLSAKFDSYGIEHEKVDGMDLFAVLEVAERATEQVRETGKPYAIEAMTYRIAPHGAADFLEQYRTKEEIAEWRKRDPIGSGRSAAARGRRARRGASSRRSRDEAKERVDEAVKFAEESPEPPDRGAVHRCLRRSGKDEYPWGRT